MIHHIKNLIALLEQFEEIYGKSSELDNIKVQVNVLLEAAQTWARVLREAKDKRSTK